MKITVHKLWKSIKESHCEALVAFQFVALFASVLMIARLTDTVVAVSSTYGDRELPIYSVGIEEKRISISFDAAWGAEDFNHIMEVLDKHQVKTPVLKNRAGYVQPVMLLYVISDRLLGILVIFSCGLVVHKIIGCYFFHKPASSVVNLTR